MNTPSHCIINLTLLGKKHTLAIIMGGFLPDSPLFIFYLLQKFYFKSSEQLIWSTLYYQSSWQLVFDLFHSIPLALAGLLISFYYRLSILIAFFASLILHSFADFPLHHNDAHRHFLPISQWRFESPISYWDPLHYGQIFGSLEILAVIISCFLLFSRYPSKISRFFIIGIALLYVGFLSLMITYWFK